jgi:serine O-acetyltransferase
MKAKRLEDVYEATIAALAAPGVDALAKADAEGYPDYDEAVAWTERVKTVVLHQRDRGALRSELPVLAERLLRFLARVPLPEGVVAEAIAAEFVARLPRVRQLLAEDLEAAFEGDPAAKSFAEIVVAYPSIQAIAVYRLAHELVALGAPQLPRIMAEYAHDRTGIDIHPGARIGDRFFIDHGTGVVIGETCDIGSHVKLYQGVTLGALSFATDADGNLVRGHKRHPTLEDRVVVYANATVLGGKTVIGHDSVVGSSAWVTRSVQPYTTVTIEPPKHRERSEMPDELLPELNYSI